MAEGTQQYRDHTGEVFALEQPSLSSTVLGFVHAVEWSEWWLWALAAFHLSLLLLALLTRTSFPAQCTLWLCISVLVYGSQYLNTLAHEHWSVFATQDYFDDSGFFAFVMWGGPLLAIQMLIIIQTLISVSGLLIKVKRKELALEQKQKEQ
eukprot:TRINITY_DN12567_c0_g1_i1.p2 TRINITY_DN12567_c0_g1~~TRINITY_DN12567_c0_g1_i1.p2  ORF type:complete len:151 (-),score=64.53 TRINITY_DN12567_c0_g1_i1:166-618(-)